LRRYSCFSVVLSILATAAAALSVFHPAALSRARARCRHQPIDPFGQEVTALAEIIVYASGRAIWVHRHTKPSESSRRSTLRQKRGVKSTDGSTSDYDLQTNIHRDGLYDVQLPGSVRSRSHPKAAAGTIAATAHHRPAIGAQIRESRIVRCRYRKPHDAISQHVEEKQLPHS